MEELVSRNKDLHVAAALYALDELRRQLRRDADRGRLAERIESDKKKFNSDCTADGVLEKLAGEVAAAVERHAAAAAERYHDDAEHRRMVEELLDARAHAASALRY